MIISNLIFIISSFLPRICPFCTIMTKFTYKPDHNDQKEMLHAQKRHHLMLRYSKLKLFRQLFGLGSGPNTPHHYAPKLRVSKVHYTTCSWQGYRPATLYWLLFLDLPIAQLHFRSVAQWPNCLMQSIENEYNSNFLPKRQASFLW